MRILVDLDGTIADWGERWDYYLNRDYPMSNVPRHNEQTSFNLRLGLGADDVDIVKKVMDYPKFYSLLKPIRGSLDAVREMHNAGHEVWIVTTPTVSNPNCAQDKYEWVEDMLGEFWVNRVILTFDKTLVKGDILFDDRPDIHGAVDPEWTQILYRQPYNRSSDLPAIEDWDEWESAILDVELGKLKSSGMVEPFPGAFMEAAPRG